MCLSAQAPPEQDEWPTDPIDELIAQAQQAAAHLG